MLQSRYHDLFFPGHGPIRTIGLVALVLFARWLNKGFPYLNTKAHDEPLVGALDVVLILVGLLAMSQIQPWRWITSFPRTLLIAFGGFLFLLALVAVFSSPGHYRSFDIPVRVAVFTSRSDELNRMTYAYVGVHTAPGTAADVRDSIARLGEVSEAHVVAGDFDIIVELEVGGASRLDYGDSPETETLLYILTNDIQNIQGVTSTRTYVVIG